jgi:hypothetical protein
MAASDQENGWRSVVGRFVFVGVKTLGSALVGLVLYLATGNDLFLFGALISICLSVPYDPKNSVYSPPVLVGCAVVIEVLLVIGYFVVGHPLGYTLLCAAMGFALIYCRKLEADLQRAYQWTFIASLYSFSRMRGDSFSEFLEKLLLVPPFALGTYFVCFRLLSKRPATSALAAIGAFVRFVARKLHLKQLAMELITDLRTFRDPIVRQAARIATILAAASLFVFAFHRRSSEWLIFSAATIASSDGKTSLTRAKDRATGATIGVAGGIGLAIVLPPSPLLDAVIALVLLFGMVAFRDYALGVATRTLLVIISALALDHQSVAAGIATGLVRLENIYIGIAIALAGLMFLWPTLPKEAHKGALD